MKFSQLKNIPQKVSNICLGTMTFGEQNSIEESHAILDASWEREVNFFDTAEMYPIPPRRETHHRTEEILGKWDKFHTERENIVMATKVIGPSEMMKYIRDGEHELNKKNIHHALEGSLRRLQTDYVDLYQIHWPARETNFFGRRGYNCPSTRTDSDELKITLEALAELVESKKVRAIGLSNETPWGVMKFQQLAREFDLPVMSTIQNPYSLLNRTYEVGLAEVSFQEEIYLIPYSPLGFGVLTGKYLEGRSTPRDRLNLWNSYSRYSNPNAKRATQQYLDLAKSRGMSLTELALAFVNTRPFVASTIIGATTVEQVIENINTADIELDSELLSEINKIHEENPNPSP